MSENPGSAGSGVSADACIDAARDQLTRMGSHIGDLAASNRSLVEPPAAATEYTFSGMMGIRSVVIATTVEGYAVGEEARLDFSGTAWGPALNVGEFVGGGSFGYLSPDEVAGSCTFELHSAGLGPGMLQVIWIRHKQVLGVFLGGGPAIGITLPSGGSGTWKFASE
jgi:hypothetical protein